MDQLKSLNEREENNTFKSSYIRKYEARGIHLCSN